MRLAPPGAPWRLGAAAAVFTLAAGLAPAAAQQPIEDVLGGFEDEAPSPSGEEEPDRPAGEPAAQRWITLGGAVSQDVSFNYAHDAPLAGETDHRGLSGLRSRAGAQLDLTLSPDWRGRIAGYGFQDWAYGIQGRDGFTGEFLDAYESDAALGEAWVQGRLGRGADLKAGRQVVVWGKSDNIRITDVLNPLDVRLPGRTDIEDLRLPATMTKLDFFAGDWNLSAIVVHEIRFNKTPVFGSEFFPAAAPLPPEDDPREGFGAPEYAVALNGIFAGWDLSLYGASIYDDQPHVETTLAGPRLRRSRLGMGGVAANAAMGNWLLKGEAAWFDGLGFFQAPGETFARLDVLAGIEYSGFANTVVSVEAANRHLFGFDSGLEFAPDFARRNDFETAIRISRTFLNDTLQLMALASMHGPRGENGGFQRLQIAYDWTDSVEVSAGVINYMSGDKLRFQGIGDNDRLFARIEYRF